MVKHSIGQSRRRAKPTRLAAFRPTTSCFFACALAAASAQTAQVRSASPPEISTHYVQSDFRLPFDVGPATRRPKHLDLLVSRDGGQNWRTHQSATPTDRAFTVSGAVEGEYLLAIQARDESAAIISQKMMRLVVDRTRPNVELNCRWDGQQSLTIQAIVRDQHPDLNRVQLTCRTDASQEPRTISVTPVNHGEKELVAETMIPLPAGPRFELALIAADLAGNVATTVQKYDSPQQFIERTESVADAATKHFNAHAVLDTTTIQRLADLTVASRSIPSHGMVSAMLASQPVLASPQSSVSVPRDGSTPAESNLPVPVSVPQTSPTIENDGTVRMVTEARQFAIAYQHAADVSGLTCVELWGTVDHGTTWVQWGIDDDRISPCKIEVPSEGEFGFCVVPIEGPQDVALRPRSGDKPDLIVEVRSPSVPRRRASITLAPTAP